MSDTPTPNSAATPSRRGFLRTMAAAGLAGSVAPFVRASNKSGLEPIIVGTGEYTFEVIHDWGTLPKSMSYGNTHGVCETASGNILIKHTVGGDPECKDAVVEYDAKGTFVRSWGSEFRGGAHGLHLARDGSDDVLYLCDPNRGLVVKTDVRGNEIWRRGCPVESGLYNNPGEYKPTNVAVAADGTVYVGDGYGKSWLHIYKPDGTYVRSFGGPGNQRGQVSCPHGLAIDARSGVERLVVADRSNRRLQYFTLDGRHDGFVTDEMRAPCHFHFHGSAMVVPDLEGRVTILDKDNKLIAHLCDGWTDKGFELRDKPRDRFVPGKFIAPHSAIFDHEGNIFVVEWVEVGRVTKLRRV
ncbi:MAG: hypothetical protein AMXMBFR58_27020 [Phycisphaerae bacterium]